MISPFSFAPFTSSFFRPPVSAPQPTSLPCKEFFFHYRKAAVSSLSAPCFRSPHLCESKDKRNGLLIVLSEPRRWRKAITNNNQEKKNQTFQHKMRGKRARNKHVLLQVERYSELVGPTTKQKRMRVAIGGESSHTPRPRGIRAAE